MRILLPYLLLVMLCCNSCTESSEIGANFFEAGSLGIDFTDTLTLKVSTVTYDSMITSGTNRLLVGHYNDAQLGTISSSAIFEIGPTSSTNQNSDNPYFLDANSSSYIKTRLMLTYDKYSYYDTTIAQTLYVHQLIDELEENESGLFYNTTEARWDQQPIGSLQFKAKPNSADSLEIPISDDLGRKIYNAATTEDDALDDLDSFVDEIIKGIALVADPQAQGPFLGFSSAVKLKVYYLDRTLVPNQEKYLAFNVSARRYNKIAVDRQTTKLKALSRRKISLNSDVTDQTSYIQGGTGLSVRIEVPYLKTILIDNPNLIVTDAILTFRPVSISRRANTPYPTSLQLYASNYKNDIYADLSSQEGGGVAFNSDMDLNRDTHYSANVTSFVKSQLALEEFNENALLVSLSNEDLVSTVDKLYVGNQQNEYQMRLKIYFALVRE